VLEEARRQVPALAILDVGLPDISGFELCRQLLAQHPSLPVLFLTARSDEVDKLLGLEMGRMTTSPKPFSPRSVRPGKDNFTTDAKVRRAHRNCSYRAV
jgi:two-component system catabolic regulation response regulator CreB